MHLLPSENLSEEQIESGMNRVVKEGIVVEAMATLTGGAFLVAMALKLGASNFQIGLLAALPTISNIFQLVAIYLVQKLKNRRAITVYSSLLARLPLLVIAFLPFLFSLETSLVMLLTLLFVHFFFSTITGLSWNSWMKDLVPEKQLGTYFSHRGRLIQILNVSLSLGIAFMLDHVKEVYPQYEMITYSGMFCLGSLTGLIGVYLLAKTPEPKLELDKTINVFTFFKNPLKDVNFRNFVLFNSFWAFALGLATPFFSVYLLTVLKINLSYIIGLNILSQFSSIFFIKVWGRLCDKYSNKTILSVCAPLYVGTILLWPFAQFATIPILILIYAAMGASFSGINLSLGNIGYKLAPKKESITYMSTRSMITAFFSAVAPIVGGLAADYLTTLDFSFQGEMKASVGSFLLPMLNHLEVWDFFFIMGAVLALLSLKRLALVNEEGEVNKKLFLNEVKLSLRNGTREKSNSIKKLAIRSFNYSRSSKRLRLKTPGKAFDSVLNIKNPDEFSL